MIGKQHGFMNVTASPWAIQSGPGAATAACAWAELPKVVRPPAIIVAWSYRIVGTARQRVSGSVGVIGTAELGWPRGHDGSKGRAERALLQVLQYVK